MVLLVIAWRNLWRHSRRSLITAGAMALGAGFCMATMAYVAGMYGMMSRVMIDEQLGHVQVHQVDYPKKKGMLDTMPEGLIDSVLAVPGVERATERAFGNALISSDDKTTGVQLVGIDPTRERTVTAVAERMDAGTYLSAEPAHEILLGKDLAEKLGVHVGDEVVLVTQASDGSLGNDLYTVHGVFRSGQTVLDRAGAFLHLRDLQDLLVLPGQVHEILAIGADVDQADALATAVRDALAPPGGTPADPELLVQSWRAANPATAQMMSMSSVSKGVIVFFVFGLAAFGVVNTMVMSVFERTKELGVAIAVGMRPRQVVTMVMLESLLLGVVASVAGGAFGALLDWLLVTYGMSLTSDSGKTIDAGGIMFDPIVYGKVDPNDIVVVLISVVVVSVVASLWPAVRAARLRPVESMRQE